MSRHILCEDVGYSIHTSMLTQNSSESRQSERWKSDCRPVFPGTWEPNSRLTFLAYKVTAGWFRCMDCLLHISFFAEGNDERGARNVSANASQSCFQSAAGLQVAYWAWQGLSWSSIPDAGSYHVWEWAKDEMGKEKSLIIFSQKYQRVKTVTAAGYLVMSVIPLLLVGIVMKGSYQQLSQSYQQVQRL